jgi:hypothetical protein
VPFADKLSDATFWVTLLVSILVGALVIIVAIWGVSPRKRLIYGMRTVRVLDPRAKRDELQVTWEGRLLGHPAYVIDVKVANRGYLDIGNQMFNGDDPLEFNLGANVFAVLGHSIEPEVAGRPQWGLRGSLLRINPMIIHRDDVLSFSFLVDGSVPSLTRVDPHPLLDVKVRPGDPDLPRPGLKLLKALWKDPALGTPSLALASMLAVAAAALANFLLGGR